MPGLVATSVLTEIAGQAGPPSPRHEHRAERPVERPVEREEIAALPAATPAAEGLAADTGEA
jgi:hypothetical protein